MPLVIFTMIVMSILTEAFGTTSADDASVVGGWDISARVNPNTPISDFRQAIESSPGLDSTNFEAIGSYTFIPVQVRQQGAEEQRWRSYSVRAADEGYLEGTETQFHLIAEGYGTTAEEVWDALRADSTLVVVDSFGCTHPERVPWRREPARIPA